MPYLAGGLCESRFCQLMDLGDGSLLPDAADDGETA